MVVGLYLLRLLCRVADTITYMTTEEHGRAVEPRGFIPKSSSLFSFDIFDLEASEEVQMAQNLLDYPRTATQ